MYPQGAAPALPVDWWECGRCRGWFAWPVPSSEAIAAHEANVSYMTPDLARRIADAKKPVLDRLLSGCAQRTALGPLLDFGCNFGEFMALAREKGWAAAGFEPDETAAGIARARGFEVRSGWSLEDAGFADGSFSAVTAVDSFCYAWEPAATLAVFFSLLRPGGVLAMRITNRRFALGCARALSRPGSGRNALMSRLLHGRFHAIGLGSLTQILRRIGFTAIAIEPRAPVARMRDASWISRLGYMVAEPAYVLSFGRLNLFPGVLLFACKPGETGQSHSAEVADADGIRAGGGDCENGTTPMPCVRSPGRSD